MRTPAIRMALRVWYALQPLRGLTPHQRGALAAMTLLVLAWCVLFIRATETPLPFPETSVLTDVRTRTWHGTENGGEHAINYRDPAAADRLETFLESRGEEAGAVADLYLDGHSQLERMERAVIAGVVGSGGAATDNVLPYGLTRRDITAVVPAGTAESWRELGRYRQAEGREAIRGWLSGLDRAPAPVAAPGDDRAWEVVHVRIARGRVHGGEAWLGIYYLVLLSFLPLLMAGIPLLSPRNYAQLRATPGQFQGLGSFLAGMALHSLAVQFRQFVSPLVAPLSPGNDGLAAFTLEITFPIAAWVFIMGTLMFQMLRGRAHRCDPFQRPIPFVAGSVLNLFLIIFQLSPLGRL